MKKFLLSVAAVAALGVSVAPAAAQSYDRGYGDRGYGYGQNQNASIARGDNLAARIDRAQRNRQITSREAARLRTQLAQAERLALRYRQGGLNNWERADLDRRFDAVRLQLRHERNDRDYGSGYGDRDGRWDR